MPMLETSTDDAALDGMESLAGAFRMRERAAIEAKSEEFWVAFNDEIARDAAEQTRLDIPPAGLRITIDITFRD